MKKYVYAFGGGAADGDGKMKEVLGGKGAGLAEMSRAGVPVPPGFTISSGRLCYLVETPAKQTTSISLRVPCSKNLGRRPARSASWIVRTSARCMLRPAAFPQRQNES